MGSIIVSNLSKSYKRYNNKWARLKEWITGKNNHTSHSILKNINFEISAGEAVGIIGVNGAGKSTLLKLITGTTHPTEGHIKLTGRVSALLELGLGFHPDFTGRQNAYISAQYLGFDNATVESLMPSIEEFAEIGGYFDEPMRTYSSGMQMRVAFSVATALRPDILIVDEALSVGDAYFQHKSFDRIRQFRDLGTTILFVSHSAGAIKTLCNRAILIDNGIIVRDGSPDTVMDYYNAVIAQNEADHKIKQAEHHSGKTSTRSGNFAAKIEEVELLVNDQSARAITMGAEATLLIRGQVNQNINELTVGMVIRDRLGNEVFGTNTHHHNSSLTHLVAGQLFALEFQFPSLALGRGTYSISIALHSGNAHVADNYDWWDRAIVFQVVPNSAPMFVGVFNVPLNIKWTTDSIHTQQNLT